MTGLRIGWRRLLGGALLVGAGFGVGAPIAVTLADGDPPAAAPRANVSVQPTFTYQGRLEIDGVPADGDFDMSFAFFDDDTPGAPDVQLALIELDAVAVTNGTFSVELAPGAGVFNGSERWIEVGARPEGSSDPYVTLGARQELSATPIAIYSMTTGPHDHLGETWTGDQDRTGFPAKAIFNVTNTNASTGISDYSGIGIKGTANATGIGVYGVTIANDGDTMLGHDRNSTIGAVVGHNLTLNCAGTCVGVKGFAGGSTTGFGRAYGVYGLGATAGILGASNATGVIGEGGSVGVQGTASSASGYGVYGKGNAQSNATGVVGESIVPNGADGIGVQGVSGAYPPVRPINTGVYGYAAAQDATGVYGRADGLNAIGVKGVGPTSQEYAGYFSGKVHVAGNFSFTSDARAKHDLQPIARGLEDVLALQPKSYVFNGDDSETTRLGLIAQDVREVMPELVSEDPVSGLLAMNYIDVIPVLVRAIQEQDEEIAGLRGGAGMTQEPRAGGPSWPLPSAMVFAGLAMLVLSGVVMRGQHREH